MKKLITILFLISTIAFGIEKKTPTGGTVKDEVGKSQEVVSFGAEWVSKKTYKAGEFVKRGTTLYVALIQHTSADFGTDWITNQYWTAMTAHPGTVSIVAGACPPGTFLADGASKSRAAYADLFKVIGTAHGYPDADNFYIPDYRGRFLRGTDGGATRDPDRGSRTAMNTNGATGDALGSVQGHLYQSHSHSMRYGGRSVQDPPSGSPGFMTAHYVWGPYYTDGAGGSETRPLNANVNYCIKF